MVLRDTMRTFVTLGLRRAEPWLGDSNYGYQKALQTSTEATACELSTWSTGSKVDLVVIVNNTGQYMASIACFRGRYFMNPY